MFFLFYDFVVYRLSRFLGVRSYGITVLIKCCPRSLSGIQKRFLALCTFPPRTHNNIMYLYIYYLQTPDKNVYRVYTIHLYIHIAYNLRTLNFQSFGFICSAIFLLAIMNLIYENNSLKPKLVYYSVMMLAILANFFVDIYFYIVIELFVSLFAQILLMVVWLPDYDLKIKSLLCTKESQFNILCRFIA